MYYVRRYLDLVTLSVCNSDEKSHYRRLHDVDMIITLLDFIRCSTPSLLDPFFAVLKYNEEKRRAGDIP